MAGRAKTIVHPTKMTVYSIFLFCIVRLFDFGKIKKLKEIKKIKTIVGGANNHYNNITLYSFVQSTLLFTLYTLLFTHSFNLLYSLLITLYSLNTPYFAVTVAELPLVVTVGAMKKTSPALSE